MVKNIEIMFEVYRQPVKISILVSHTGTIPAASMAEMKVNIHDLSYNIDKFGYQP